MKTKESAPKQKANITVKLGRDLLREAPKSHLGASAKNGRYLLTARRRCCGFWNLKMLPNVFLGFTHSAGCASFFRDDSLYRRFESWTAYGSVQVLNPFKA